MEDTIEVKQLSAGLNDLSKKIHELNVKKGFYDEQPSKDRQLMLVVSEVSEAYESVRKNLVADSVFVKESTIFPINLVSNKEFKIYVKDTEEDEIADSIIRLLDYCGNHGIDIDAHINLKLAYNQSRPYKHGKNF